MNDVDALIGWLLEAPRGHRPVEGCGATALISAISGAPVTAAILSRGPRRLTLHERHLLRAPGAAGHERRGTLYAAGVPAAAVTAVLLPQRIPLPAWQALGCGAGEGGLPLGLALAGLGARREPLQAMATPGRRDAAGREQVVWSAARLWLRHPVALVTERFYKLFLDAYPGPWAVSVPAPRAAP